jgi:hypothetical protein
MSDLFNLPISLWKHSSIISDPRVTKADVQYEALLIPRQQSSEKVRLCSIAGFNKAPIASWNRSTSHYRRPTKENAQSKQSERREKPSHMNSLWHFDWARGVVAVRRSEERPAGKRAQQPSSPLRACPRAAQCLHHVLNALFSDG